MWCLYVALVDQCKAMAKDAYESGSVDELHKTIQVIKVHRQSLKAFTIAQNGSLLAVDPLVEGSLRNPARVRTKGCGVPSTSSQPKGTKSGRKTPRCSVCGESGHNRISCPIHKQVQALSQTHIGCSGDMDEYQNADDDADFEFANVDMVTMLLSLD